MISSRLISRFSDILSPLFRASLIGLMCLSSLSFAAPNSPSEFVDYDKLLKEQRQWAGLSAKSLRVGDITWHYNEGGDRSKPTILMLHGLMSDRDSWNAVAQGLTASYHVIIPNLPTSGDTQVPTNFDLSMPNITEHLRRFVETLGIQDDLNIAGHSLGGTIAMLYASQYALDTQSLLLVSSGGVFSQSHSQYLRQPIYLKQLLVTQPGDLAYLIKKSMYSPPFTPSIVLKEKESRLIAQAAMNAKTIDQLLELNKLYTHSSYVKMAKNIEAPSLIIWGQNDQIIHVDVAQELKKMLKRAREPVILNQVGHMPLLEKPESVIQHYQLFLREHAQATHPMPK